MKRILFIVLTALPFWVNAQQKTVHTNMVWVGYFNTLHFNEKWSLASDFQLRSREWANKWSQIVLRSGGQYNFNDRTSVAAGFAWFKNATYVNKQLILRNEWRPWQEFSYKASLNSKGALLLIQRLRTEERFIQDLVNNQKTDNYSFVFRVRYKAEFQFPLWSDNLSAGIANEVMVNPADISNSNFFDQDRIFAGINWKISNAILLQWQYLKIFQRRNSIDVTEDQDVIRFNVRHDLNFKRKS